MLRLTAIDIVQLDDEKISDFCLCKSIIDKVYFFVSAVNGTNSP